MMNDINICLSAIEKFKKEKPDTCYCYPGDGGFEYKSRMDDAKYYLELSGVTFSNDNINDYIEFDNPEDAKLFYNATYWLNGIDKCLCSSGANVILENNKVIMESFDW